MGIDELLMLIVKIVFILLLILIVLYNISPELFHDMTSLLSTYTGIEFETIKHTTEVIDKNIKETATELSE